MTNRHLTFLLIFLGLHLTTAGAAAPAEIRFNSFSVLIRPANLEIFGLDYHLEVTSAGAFQTSNGEMEWAPADVPTTHQGGFFFTDPILFETYFMDFRLDIPVEDTDATGLMDLLEYSPAAGGRTFGEYLNAEGAVGEITAVWQKSANSHLGTVSIHLDFMNEPFVHQFEIFEYRAAWNYARTGDTSQAVVLLKRAGAEEMTLMGNLEVNSPRAGELTLLTTSFSTEAGETLSFAAPDPFERSGHELWVFPEVADGTPPLEPADFNDWILQIIDPNDTDRDGIPDVADAPTVVADPLRLDIELTAGGVRLTLRGPTGTAYALEESTSMAPPAWGNSVNITLSASPQTVELPRPDAPTFWRLRAL